MKDQGDDPIEQELADAQAEFLEAVERVRLRRQAAVLRAREAGKSKYRIAQVMHVKETTVTSIITAAQTDRQGG